MSPAPEPPATERVMPVIRPAVAEDADVIAEFNRRLALETEQLQLDPATIAAGVRAVLADPAKGSYFVAVAGGEVVGQLMHTREWSDWRNGDLWWLQSVYVREDFRGQGLFRRLFEDLQQRAQQTPEVVGLRLYVERHNARAQTAYHRLGMVAAGYEVFEQVWKNAPTKTAAATPPPSSSLPSTSPRPVPPRAVFRPT